MEKMKIFFRSDFEVSLKRTGGWNVPFVLKFFADKVVRNYVASFDGTTYKNCKVDIGDASNLIVFFNEHGLGIGTLKVMASFDESVEEFSGEVFDREFAAEDCVFETDAVRMKTGFSGAPGEFYYVRNESKDFVITVEGVSAQLYGWDLESQQAPVAECFTISKNPGGTESTIVNRQGNPILSGGGTMYAISSEKEQYNIILSEEGDVESGIIGKLIK